MSVPEIEPFAPPLATPWVPLWPLSSQQQFGDEIAYAELTTDMAIPQVVQASAGTVIALPPLTFDGVTPIILDFHVPGLQPAAGNSFMHFTIWDGSTDLGIVSVAQGLTMFASGRRKLTPSAGTHTYILKAFVTNAGANIINAGRLPTSFRVRRVLPTPPQFAPAALTPVTIGTSLPVGPADGQEAILVDSLAAPTYSWRFRYTASITDAYKWVYIGGAPWTKHVAATETTSTGAFGDLTTVQAFTVPRAGLYHARASYAALWSTTDGGAVAAGMRLDFGATLIDANTKQQSMPLNGGAEYSGALNALDVIATKWRTSNVNINVRDRTLTVTPLRVA